MNLDEANNTTNKDKKDFIDDFKHISDDIINYNKEKKLKFIDMYYFKDDIKMFENLDKDTYNDEYDFIEFDKDTNLIHIIEIYSFDSEYVGDRTVNATEYQISNFNIYDEICAKDLIDGVIEDNDIWFFDGAGYHYLKNCKIVDGKIIIAQTKIPSKI